MSVLFPPICLQVTFSSVSQDTSFLPATNYWMCTLTNSTSQGYNNGTTNLSYNGSSIALGMWVTSSSNGSLFRIKRIDSQTSTTVRVSLEDVNGFNKRIGLVALGGRPTNGVGYVFQINPATGLPCLTSIPSSPTLTFPDSILGRFMYMQTGGSATGPTGPASNVTGPTGPSGGEKGATGPTGPSGGERGPTGPMALSFSFNGGSANQNYSFGPSFNCGSSI